LLGDILLHEYHAMIRHASLLMIPMTGRLNTAYILVLALVRKETFPVNTSAIADGRMRLL